MISGGTLPCAASGSGSGNGQVKLSLSYASQERQLIVIVHACRCVSSKSVQKHSRSDCALTNHVLYCWFNHSYLRRGLRKGFVVFFVTSLYSWHNLNLGLSFEKLTMLLQSLTGFNHCSFSGTKYSHYSWICLYTKRTSFIDLTGHIFIKKT